MSGGLGELSDQRINSIARQIGIPDFGGCYAKDQLADRPTGKQYVLNMQNHTGGGTHWVLLDTLKHPFQYCDSFGVAPPQEVDRYASAHGTTVIHNPVDIQSYHSDACGWYCLYMMLMMQKRTMNSIIHDDFVNLHTMKPRRNNDSVLSRTFQSFIHSS